MRSIIPKVYRLGIIASREAHVLKRAINKLWSARHATVSFRWQRWKGAVVRLGICVILIPVSLVACASSQSSTKENVTAFKKKMQVQAAFAEAALMQQCGIKLIAPDVQSQLQYLATDIAVRVGTDMSFRVHITNDPYVGTMSLASGDIFLPTGYLNMVANRDEIAFGLAREIAVQHRQLPLRDMEARYLEERHREMVAEVYGIVTSAAIHGVYQHYVTRPIHQTIMKEIKIPVQTILVEDSRGGIKQAVSPSTQMQYRQVGESVSTLISPFGWVPSIATSASLKMISRLITVASEESDAGRRRHKNDLGLAYMEMAGYSPSAGQNVIQKLDQFWEEHESKE